MNPVLNGELRESVRFCLQHFVFLAKAKSSSFFLTPLLRADEQRGIYA